MARPFPTISNLSHPLHLLFFSTHFSFLILSTSVILSIFALLIFLCTSSRKSNKSQQGRNNFVSKMNSNISSRAISMAKMISWRKVEAAEEEEEEEEERGSGGCDFIDKDEEEEVWRKTIIRGERCRPLEFSGKIDYDSDGNLLCDSNRDFK
ncbi:hypothetical protein Csa_010872 [Cucumis sativus]|uniref:Uncharacterized protein n=1 Tax=Cucumis sativus TaxID=3659 RepID=A0A0A0L7R8_CUCSA|nr:hypothetical protein Csa_010872 [Cucumis sativus]